MARVFIGLGSNVGDRAAHLQAAKLGLARLPRTRLVNWSTVYQTAPVGPVPQGDFLNAAAELETELSPAELLAALRELEAQAGRAGDAQRVHWGPRQLDLDILFYDRQVIRQDGLTVPHPRLHERWFVLKPLADLDGNFIHPVLGKSIAELLAGVEPGHAEVFRGGRRGRGRGAAEKP